MSRNNLVTAAVVVVGAAILGFSDVPVWISVILIALMLYVGSKIK